MASTLAYNPNSGAGCGQTSTAHPQPAVGYSQLAQQIDPRDTLRQYQHLHITGHNHQSAPKAPMDSSSKGIPAFNSAIYESGNAPTITTMTTTSALQPGSYPQGMVEPSTDLNPGVTMYGTNPPPHMEQYAALVNQYENSIHGTGGAGGMAMMAPSSGPNNAGTTTTTCGTCPQCSNGVTTTNNSATYIYDSSHPTQLGHGSPYTSTAVDAPSGKNYTTTSQTLVTPKQTLATHHRTTNVAQVPPAVTTDVKGDPRSNTITLSTKTIAPARDGRGMLIESVDTYTYRRPETTNGEYGNFPRRTHTEHVIDNPDAGNDTSGIPTSFGGPGTAEERPSLERHGNTTDGPIGGKYLP
ncbi:hypothetical protein HK104_002884 [Borealophlyctis nickersoniae]|nr:hypothetical protein HK104_002884 [Borealophlyctis nickersoniae]